MSFPILPSGGTPFKSDSMIWSYLSSLPTPLSDRPVKVRALLVEVELELELSLEAGTNSQSKVRTPTSPDTYFFLGHH